MAFSSANSYENTLESAWFRDKNTHVKFVNDILENLQLHYKQMDVDLPTRMGVITSLVGEFHVSSP